MEIITALITSVIGGALVAIVNHLFTRKKTDAEIEKLKAETKKILAEAEKISSDTKHVLGEVDYHDATDMKEEVVYDGSLGFHGVDLTSEFADYNIEHGALIISGDFASLSLQTYIIDDEEYSYIPKNPLVSGHRKFHVSCDVKVTSEPYDMAISMWETPEVEDDPCIDDRSVRVTHYEWERADFYFRAPPDKDYVVKISAERFKGRGSLQIRHLVVTERVETKRDTA